MEKKFLLNSHSGEKNYLVETEPNKYRLECENDCVGFVREKKDGKFLSCDPSGGPMICVGDLISEKIIPMDNVLDEFKVTEINWAQGEGIYIRVEK